MRNSTEFHDVMGHGTIAADYRLNSSGGVAHEDLKRSIKVFQNENEIRNTKIHRGASPFEFSNPQMSFTYQYEASYDLADALGIYYLVSIINA
jgi:hypothetical protein